MILDNTKQALLRIGKGDSPDDSDTVISAAIKSVADQRCRAEYCVFYMMSDLIEANVRKMAHQGSLVDEDLIKRKANQQFDGLKDPIHKEDHEKLEILVWGIGRDEIAKRELGPAGKNNLEKYWGYLLSRIGFDKNYQLVYEFPDLAKSSFPEGRDIPYCKYH